MSQKAPPIHPQVRIGHVHLKVADLDRALNFYHRVLGFEITQRYGKNAAFLSAGGYHHHIGLNTWESQGGSASALSRARKRAAHTRNHKTAREGGMPRMAGDVLKHYYRKVT